RKADRVRDQIAQREVPPAQVWGVDDGTGCAVERPGRADADTGEIIGAAAVLSCDLIAALVDQRNDAVDYVLRPAMSLGWHGAQAENIAVAAIHRQRTHGYVGAAQIDADHPLLVFAGAHGSCAGGGRLLPLVRCHYAPGVAVVLADAYPGFADLRHTRLRMPGHPRDGNRRAIAPPTPAAAGARVLSCANAFFRGDHDLQPAGLARAGAAWLQRAVVPRLRGPRRRRRLRRPDTRGHRARARPARGAAPPRLARGPRLPQVYDPEPGHRGVVGRSAPVHRWRLHPAAGPAGRPRCPAGARQVPVRRVRQAAGGREPGNHTRGRAVGECDVLALAAGPGCAGLAGAAPSPPARIGRARTRCDHHDPADLQWPQLDRLAGGCHPRQRLRRAHWLGRPRPGAG